jgi:hypothetical protein
MPSPVYIAGMKYRTPKGKFRDLTGQRFGMLEVRCLLGSKERNIHFACRCDCGKEIEVMSQNLYTGRQTSCGCLKLTRGGRSTEAEYAIWNGMLQRCYNQKQDKYDCWGGRGIRVCEKWRASYDAFYDDMGPRPSPKHSIDRIDNDGNYEPGNCRWATQSQQARNTRPPKGLGVAFRGKTQSLLAWSRELGIPWGTLYKRVVRKGWPVEEAFTRPVNQKFSTISRLSRRSDGGGEP